MDLMTALQLVLKKAAAHDGLAKGLREAAKAIEKHAAQLCILAEDCDQPDYVKLVKALCAEHNVHLITVPASKTIGEWAGVCLFYCFFIVLQVRMFFFLGKFMQCSQGNKLFLKVLCQFLF